MRISLRWLMPLFFIAAALTSLADPPAKIAVPTVFSYDIPHGWTSVNIPGSSFPTAVDTVATVDGKGQAKAMITVNADTNKGNLIQWCNQSWAQNKAQFTQLGATIGEMQIFHTNVPTTSGMSATIDLTARGRPSITRCISSPATATPSSPLPALAPPPMPATTARSSTRQ